MVEGTSVVRVGDSRGCRSVDQADVLIELLGRWLEAIQEVATPARYHNPVGCMTGTGRISVGSKRKAVAALLPSFGTGALLRLSGLTALVVACVGFFAVISTGVVHSVREGQNRERLQELAASTLHRAELGADYAFITLGELSEQSDIVCSPATVRLFRSQIYRRAIVKDVRIIGADGNTLCSAFPGVLDAGNKRLDLDRALESRNGQIRLLPLEGHTAFGVLWKLDPDRSILAVVNTGTLVYDVLPGVFRDNGEARVLLSDGSLVAAYPGGNPVTLSASDPAAVPLTFSAASGRYPLRAEIRINAGLVANLNSRINPIYPLGGGVLGLIFGLMAVRALTGPRNVAAELDRALSAREFVPFAQPIFCLKDGRIAGCEILARRISRDGSVTPPSEFIPLAEQTGKIVPITWQIVDKALADLRPFMRSDKRFSVAFNITAAHLMDPAFASDLRTHVLGARVASRQITIELTERQEIENLEEAARTISKLKERGFRVSIDDAGTGHSGLSYIQKLGADVIKIDKLFVDSVVDDPSARSLIKMLVRLAGDLKMSTVAEGIETEEQREALAELGVDKGQGYLVSRPLPLDSFLKFVGQKQTSASADLAA